MKTKEAPFVFAIRRIFLAHGLLLRSGLFLPVLRRFFAFEIFVPEEPAEKTPEKVTAADYGDRDPEERSEIHSGSAQRRHPSPADLGAAGAEKFPGPDHHHYDRNGRQYPVYHPARRISVHSLSPLYELRLYPLQIEARDTVQRDTVKTPHQLLAALRLFDDEGSRFRREQHLCRIEAPVPDDKIGDRTGYARKSRNMRAEELHRQDRARYRGIGRCGEHGAHAERAAEGGVQPEYRCKKQAGRGSHKERRRYFAAAAAGGQSDAHRGDLDEKSQRQVPLSHDHRLDDVAPEAEKIAAEENAGGKKQHGSADGTLPPCYLIIDKHLVHKMDALYIHYRHEAEEYPSGQHRHEHSRTDLRYLHQV